MLINRLPDPHRFEDNTIKSLLPALQGNVEGADWMPAILRVVEHLMKKFCHPALNWHIKGLGNLFVRMFSVAKEVGKKGELDSNMRCAMNQLECYPKVQK